MSAASGFRLLSVPNLILEEVMKNFDLVEVFFLSLCSRRTWNFLKSCPSRFSKFQLAYEEEGIKFLELKTGSKFIIKPLIISDDDEEQKMKLKNLKIDNQHFQFLIDNEKSVIDYSAPNSVLPKIFQFFYSENLGAVIYENMKIKTFANSKTHNFQIEWDLKNRKTEFPGNSKIQKIQIENILISWNTESGDSDLESILEVFQKTFQKFENVFIHVTPRQDFKFSSGKSIFHSKKLRIKPSKWFSGANLYHLDSEEVILEKSNLKNRDINGFLKSWKTEKTAVNLKYLHVEMRELNLSRVVAGLGEKWIDATDERRIYMDTKTGQPIQFIGVYTIRREFDGVMAMLYTNQGISDRILLIFHGSH